MRGVQPRIEGGQGISRGGGTVRRAGFSDSAGDDEFINLATLALEMMFAPRGTELGSMWTSWAWAQSSEAKVASARARRCWRDRTRLQPGGDDVVKVTLVDGREVLCTSAELDARPHGSARIGIINVAQMFGVKAIRKEKALDLIISLKQWTT